MSSKYVLSSTNVEQEPVTCPFCLNDLLRGSPSPGVDEDVARLDLCSHTMHSECLQFWVTRANTCPLCRGKFNRYTVSKTLDSEVIGTYLVEDKKQAVHQFEPDLGHWAAGRRRHAPPALFEIPRAECSHCHLDDRGEPILCGFCARFYHVECLEPRRPADVLICRRCASQEERALINDGNPFLHNPSLQTRPLSRSQLAGLVGGEQPALEAARELEAGHHAWDAHEDDTDGRRASIPIRAKRRRAVGPAPTGGLSTFVEPLAWGEPIRRTRTAWPQEQVVIPEAEGALWEAFDLALEQSWEGKI